MQTKFDQFLPVRCFANNFTVPTSNVTILRCEIAGYHELAEENQRRALTLMSVLRDSADRVADATKGRLLKSVTDEIWMEFPKGTLAVEAAIALQPRFHENAVKLSLPTPALCTGIHCGEVTRSRTGDVFGDPLAIASMIRRLADAGQIVVSEPVAEQLGRKVELDDLGEISDEDLAEPVSIWAVRV